MKNEEIIGTVLANEKTCREFINQLLASGVKVNVDPNALTHAECIELGIAIYTEIARQEISNESTR